MKILMINTGIFSVPPRMGGAIEAHTYHLTKALAKLDHEIHYVTDINDDAEFDENILVHKVHAPQLKFQAGFHGWTLNYFLGGILAFRSALFALLREKFDVVHAHGNLSGLLTCMVKRDVPLVFTVHNPTPWMYTYPSIYQQKFREVSYRYVDVSLLQKVYRIISVSAALKRELISMWNFLDEKVVVIPNGVDITNFRPDIHNVHSVKRKYGIKTKYCLFVGQLRSRKGVHYLLRAFSTMSNVDINCVIVGDGPERGTLVKLANDLKLNDKVIFTGVVPFEDLPKLYSGADFFVLPTVAEGLPLVILEAMASGLPVISTNVSGVPEVIGNGHNGFIVPPKDTIALHERIKFLAQDDSLRKKMAKNARLTAVEKFSWRTVAEKTLSVYEKAIEENSS